MSGGHQRQTTKLMKLTKEWNPPDLSNKRAWYHFTPNRSYLCYLMMHFSLDKSTGHQNDNTPINNEIGASHGEARQ